MAGQRAGWDRVRNWCSVSGFALRMPSRRMRQNRVQKNSTASMSQEFSSGTGVVTTEGVNKITLHCHARTVQRGGRTQLPSAHSRMQGDPMRQPSNQSLAEIRDVLLETYAVNDAMNQLLLANL